MKKGVSELISWVLLVAFVITLGAFVAYFSTTYVKQIKPGHAQELKIYCQDTQIALSDVCRDDNNVSILFTVKNKGSFGISRLTVNREHSGSSVGSCDILNPTQVPLFGQSLLPAEEFNFTLALRPNITDSVYIIELMECPTTSDPEASPINETFKVLELSVIPWVEIEGERISCPDKKTTVSANLLNVYCVP